MPIETLSAELYWLTLTALMTGLMWVPYIINRLFEQGIGFALWDPQGDTKTKFSWAERMMRAHSNAVENLVIFAPLALAVQLTEMNNERTALACMLYFYSRLAHYIVFTLAVPVMRIITFAAGVVAQFILAFTLLGIA